MKMQKLLSLVTFGLAAAAAPVAAQAGKAQLGDIVDIRVMDQNGKAYGDRAKISGEKCSPDNPVVAGEEICIRVRLLVRNWQDVKASKFSDEEPPQTWTIAPGTDPSSFFDRPQLGLRIGEKNVWADYSDTGVETKPWQMSGEVKYDDEGNATKEYRYFTDFYFKYKVKAGDMGLPVTILTADLEPASAARTSNAYAFGNVNCLSRRCRIVSGPLSVDAALFRPDPAVVTPDYPDETYPLEDYNLFNEGIYVKTVDFDKVNAAGDPTWSEGQVWRKVYPGLSDPVVTAPAVTIQGGATAKDDQVVYVWSDDETVVVPVGDEIQVIEGDDGKFRKVLTVHIAAGATGATFALQGADGAAEGQQAKVCLSPTKDIMYNPIGAPKEAYVSRVVEITKAPQPTVQMRFENGETTHDPVTADKDYQTAKMQLVFKVVPAATEPVTVKLTATVNGAGELQDLYDDNIIRIPEGAGYDIDGMETEITINPNETVTRSVFVLGASASTEAGVNFKLSGVTVPAGAKVESVSHTVSIYRAGIGGVPVVDASPASGSEVPVEKGQPTTFRVWLQDSFKNVQRATRDATEPPTYHFVLENELGKKIDEADLAFASYTQAGGAQYVFTPTVNLTPGTYTVSVYAHSNADDGSETPRIPFVLRVADSKHVEITPATGSYEIGEGEALPLKLELNTPHDGTISRFIFLKGAKEEDYAYFSSSLTNLGAYVNKDYKEVTNPQPVRFLDGTDGGRAVTINAFLGNDQNNPKDVTTEFSEGSITVMVTNKPPALTALSIAGMSLTMKDDDKPLKKPVPLGVKKVFKITALDEVEADLNATGDEAFQVKWVIDGIEYVTKGNPLKFTDEQQVTHAFASEGKDVEVKVYLKDKDMVSFPPEPNFQCTVEVSPQPFVSVDFSQPSGLFKESQKNVETITVSLSEAPTADIEVELKVQQPTDGEITLRTTAGSVEATTTPGVYKLYFKQGARSKVIIVSEMDGTNETYGGLDVSAKVTTETPNADGTRWCDFYIESETKVLRIENEKPRILRPLQSEAANTNMNASANSPYPVQYGAEDVAADLAHGITVDISVDNTTVLTDTLTTKDAKKCNVEFEGEGVHWVTVTFTDKDDMQDSITMYYIVQPSKRLQLRAHGPAVGTASSGGYSMKYAGAKGLGAGRVYAGENGPQKVVDFVHSYSFGVTESAIAAYAYGYKADGKADDGTLGGHDWPLDKDGSWQKSATITEFYNYTADNYTSGGRHAGFLGLDSYVYGWACNNSEASKGDDSGTESFMLAIGERSDMQIPLPDGDSKNGNNNNAQQKSIPVQFWEAVFSSELLKSDNMGDINGDGIPDLFVQYFKFDVVDEMGKLAGDDIRDLNWTNEESPKPYCAEGDYLPTTARSVYGQLIPSLPETWVTLGEEFTPVLKLRGFPDAHVVRGNVQQVSALNDAWALLGHNDVSDRVYTNPQTDADSTLSYVEWLAWREFAAATYPGEEKPWENKEHFKDWSPENPTNPMRADSDGDGMTDGYEYWMWYMAHVGWVENYGTEQEVHKRLTGRRYDPRNPGEGRYLSPEDIAEAFNPNRSTGHVERDTDNDGLPDVLEFMIGTNPIDFDSDGDGLPDGWEIIMGGCNPLLQVSYTHGINDAERNFDGDAMAIGSWQLEDAVRPKPLNVDHARRWTFAILDPKGDSDGVQWFATTKPVEMADDETQCLEAGKWWLVSTEKGDFAYVRTEKPGMLTDGADESKGRLAADTKVFGIVECELPAEPPEEEGGDDSTGSLIAEEDGGEEPPAPAVELVRGYPVTLHAGETVTVVAGGEALKVKKLNGTFKAGEANACWIYGRDRTGLYDAKLGEVAKTAADYGCLALGRAAEVSGGIVCAVPNAERDVAFLHYLCYQEFGFDPRTAWNATDPLAPRWGKTIGGEAVAGVYKSTQGGYVGKPARTREFTAYDEFLLYSFFLNNGVDMGSTISYRADGAPNALAVEWGMFTTNPMGPGEVINGKENDDELGYYWGRDSDQGADTDGDGVPDGWELYVMAGPKTAKGEYVFAPPYAGFFTGLNPAVKMPKSAFSPFVALAQSTETSNQIYLGGQQNDDTLNEFREFGGTDSVAHYADYSTTIVRDPADARWLNKFFPTDPWSVDTDGDGLADNKEGDGADSATFCYGTPYDNGSLTSIPGGGLNPCSVDTDCDGLPDPWELQFKGTPASLYKGKDAAYAKDESGAEAGNALQGLTDGMDGTVADAFTYPSRLAVSIGGVTVPQVVNRDYDHDGLENWQEYLSGTVRVWRYDDPVSSLDYIPADTYFKTTEDGKAEFDLEYAVQTLKERGVLESEEDDAAVGEFWYKTLVDKTSAIYNPHFISGTASGAQYFSRVTNGWDVAYWDSELSGGQRASGAYYWFFNRIDDQSLNTVWGEKWKEVLGDAEAPSFIAPGKYPSCSPIDPDSDRDGMDDYYEIFHGMNPLLGKSGGKGNWRSVNGSGSLDASTAGLDLVHDAIIGGGVGAAPQAWGTGDDQASYKNYWQRLVEAEDYAGKKPRGTGFDFEVFPWLTGLADVDPDGDGTLNQEESIMGAVAPQTAWHHSDPTPLWMTDGSYTNSFVRMAYRLPFRQTAIPLTSMVQNKFGEEVPGFTYGEPGKEQTFFFCDFAGYEKVDGLKPSYQFGTYNPDSWNVVSSEDKMNYFASFEQNEGYDTDHDGLNDQEEVSGKFRGQSDSTDFDSPRRRQAMYFQGKERPSILQTMPTVKERHAVAGQVYPDDLSFLQYTVECWVKAETLDDATVIERASWLGDTNPGDQEYMRCNFQLGIKGGKWYTKYDPNDTTKKAVEVLSDVKASTEWTHLAASYDGKKLRLFVNGQSHGSQKSGAQPAYGSSAAWVRGPVEADGTFNPTYQNYLMDQEYQLNAIVIGASVKTCADGATDGNALDVTRGCGWNAYTRFFKGYVDEIRIWDGARSESEISGDRNVRYTAALADANRKAFYEEWSLGGVNDQYRGRYAKDENGNAYELPAELRYHWSFDSVFGAPKESLVAKVPSGFDFKGTEETPARARLSRPEGYEIAWWKTVLDGYVDTVYDNPAWIEWVPNTVAHLPRFDGTTLDSFYWSEDFKGDANGTYKFARAAEPVSYWTQYNRDGFERDGYQGASARHFIANGMDEESGTSFGKLYEFTARHLNQTGDDLLPLGGAYVKQSEDLWDNQGASSNWEIGAGSANSADGLPKWWTSYANEQYMRFDGSAGDDEEITWTTIVKWPEGGSMLITAGEAYLRDLARGYVSNDAGNYAVTGEDARKYVQRYDMDGNGIPDWWEELYGLSEVPAFADSDNDGLPNYVEYMLSEVFDFKLHFSPINPRSVNPYVSDYFYRVGDAYVGEIFTDHDLVDDAWEDNYPGYASRLTYDAFKKGAEDGWCNRSKNRYAKQCQPLMADKQYHSTLADGMVRDYPVPTLALTLRYRGEKPTSVMDTAAMVVEVYSDATLGKSPDAKYVVNGSGDGEKKEGSGSNVYYRAIGQWSNRHALGTLTPGNLLASSLELETCDDPTTLVYTWARRYYSAVSTPGGMTSEWKTEIKRGTKDEYEQAVRKYGATSNLDTDESGSTTSEEGESRTYWSSGVKLLSAAAGYKRLEGLDMRTDVETGKAVWMYGTKELGTIDLVSGEFDLNLGAFKGMYVTTSTNGTDGVTADLASMEDQSYRIVYSANPSRGMPRSLYLGEADQGYVREGKNTIVAYADLDGNGAFTPGEPYGIVKDVDVSWKGTSAAIELCELSPVTPRIALSSGASDGKKASSGGSSGDQKDGEAADRQRTIDDVYADARLMKEVERFDLPIRWIDSNRIERVSLPASGKVRLRVVRWVVDGVPMHYFPITDNLVVLDKTFVCDGTGFLTEKDILIDQALDLDWANFYNDVASNPEVTRSYGLPVNEMDYLIVVGDGRISWTSDMDTNVVKALSQVVFRRYATDRKTPTPVSPSATAGQIVRDAHPTFKWRLDELNECGYTTFKVQVSAAGKTVFDSGYLPAPARDVDGVYTWEAPVFVGDKGLNGDVYQNGVDYTWKVSMSNAKFKPDAFVTGGTYRHAVQTNGFAYGNAQVAVRYFGPAKSFQGKTIRVRAYASPDFTGLPAAAGFVANPADAETGVAAAGGPVEKANCTLIGLPKGTYYLQAFIDSNGNGVCEPWESMGYLCDRRGETADWLNPVAIKIDDKKGAGDLAEIYIEDADTDGDALPDAWEYAKNGNLTAEGVSSAAGTAAGEQFIAKDLMAELLKHANSGTESSALAAQILYTITSSRSMVSLAAGVPPEKLDPTVSVKITGLEFNSELKQIEIGVSAKIDGNSSVESPLYTFNVGEQIALQLWQTPDLAAKWQKVGDVKLITVTPEMAASDKFVVDMTDVTVGSGFFKAEIVK